MLCPWGVLRRLIDELLPARAILREHVRELGPLLEVSRYAYPRAILLILSINRWGFRLTDYGSD